MVGPSITFGLLNLTVSSYSGGGSGGEARLTENISLAYETLTYTIGKDSATTTR